MEQKRRISFPIKKGDAVYQGVKSLRSDVVELTVEKSAPETVVGESIRYSIDVVRNDSRVPVDQFTLHDTLPDNVNMTPLYTGTYNASVSMNALYKTNLSSDWKIWRENMSSSTGVELTTASLNLKENEYVRKFAIDYSTVTKITNARKTPQTGDDNRWLASSLPC